MSTLPRTKDTRTLLAAQLVFNIGFYAVVPFLAVAMRDDFGMQAAAIGLVLGARTFSQQGMFLVGGLLADRWGTKRAMLLGCLVRISGYATLAAATDFPLFLVGAILTGAGGAMFSPALESHLSRADLEVDGNLPPGQTRRRSVFVWLAITGEIGAVLGPLLGAALMGWGFGAALGLGIAVFAVFTVVLWIRLPSIPPNAARTPESAANSHGRHHPLRCLRNRSFVAFCALASVNMLAYNQLYFLIPLELDRQGLDSSWLAVLFLIASALTIALQLPVSAAVRRMGESRAMPAGFLLLAAAFAAACFGQVAGSSAIPLVVVVVLLILGHMTLRPTILAAIPGFLAPGDMAGRGAYYGLAASCGGIAVLLGNAAIGQLRHLAENGGWAGAPWILLIGAAVLPAVLLPRVLPVRTQSVAMPVGDRTS
ncbi:MFS transporter [Paenarthrobacter sp. NPDC089989]|uniref:MFS transporter n=1 Tax=unclassified Paenarthrobacter TaxID=2634190 RepID=UPI00381B0779